MSKIINISKVSWLIGVSIKILKELEEGENSENNA